MQHNEEFLEPYLPTKRQRVAINVGAHHGLWIGKFAPLFDQVFAVEANPSAAEILRNLKLQNVEVIEAAGWIEAGQTMDFNVRNDLPMQCALSIRDVLGNNNVSEAIRVPTISIDEIPKTACDLILVDVEGAELQVLQGATKTIEAWRPQLIIECHEIEHRDWLQTWLTRTGYNVAIVHNPAHEFSDWRWNQHTHLIAQYWRYRGTW